MKTALLFGGILSFLACVLGCAGGIPAGGIAKSSASSPTTTAATSTRPATPRESPKEKPWEQVGNSVTQGNLHVTLSYARVGPIYMTKFGKLQGYHAMTVKMVIKNTSKTKREIFGGWFGEGKAADEFGNISEGWSFDRFEKFSDVPYNDKDVDQSAIALGRCNIDPGKTVSSFLFFEAPVDKAKEARITLPAKEIGGTGDVRFRLPITRK